MKKSQIGENAGQIWRLLSSHPNSKMTYNEIKLALDMRDRDINAAIGWLAREDKIEFDDDNEVQESYYLIINMFIG